MMETPHTFVIIWVLRLFEKYFDNFAVKPGNLWTLNLIDHSPANDFCKLQLQKLINFPTANPCILSVKDYP
jgi:hypothetical protein